MWPEQGLSPSCDWLVSVREVPLVVSVQSVCVCYYCTGGALVTWKVNRQASVGSCLQRIKEYLWQDCIEYSSGTGEVGSALLSEDCGGSRELVTLAPCGVPQAEKTRIDNAHVWLCVTFGNRLIIMCATLSVGSPSIISFISAQINGYFSHQ